MNPPRWQDSGKDPDYRFSLANERTFLAWIRTALAVLAGAVLLHQFATALGPKWIVTVASGAMAIASALIASGAFYRWRGNEIAMRHSQTLPSTWLMGVLAMFAGLLAAACGIALLIR